MLSFKLGVPKKKLVIQSSLLHHIQVAVHPTPFVALAAMATRWDYECVEL